MDQRERDRTPRRTRAEPALVIYLDYDEVLYNWETHEEVREFLVALKSLGETVKLRLLICRLDVDEALGSLVEADIHTRFEEIFVTTYGTKKQRCHIGSAVETPRHHPCIFEPFPEVRRHEESNGEALDQSGFRRWARENGFTLEFVRNQWRQSHPYALQYSRYTGGKDECISSEYGRQRFLERQCVLLVDGDDSVVSDVNDMASKMYRAQVHAIHHPRSRGPYQDVRRRITEVVADLLEVVTS